MGEASCVCWEEASTGEMSKGVSGDVEGRKTRFFVIFLLIKREEWGGGGNKESGKSDTQCAGPLGQPKGTGGVGGTSSPFRGGRCGVEDVCRLF